MKIKVFIADDHAIVRDGLRALLEVNPEIEVIGDAGDGVQAIGQVRRLVPDVIIMDISMPGIDGISAAQQILADRPEVRIIFLSMTGTPDHVFRALQAGASGYLLKESAGREVMEAILAVYDGDIYLSQPVSTSLISDYLLHRQQTTPKSVLDQLSPREHEILKLVVNGKTSAEIAGLLFLSPKTVESYRSRMMRKLGIHDLQGLMKFAIQEGLIV